MLNPQPKPVRMPSPTRHDPTIIPKPPREAAVLARLPPGRGRSCGGPGGAAARGGICRWVWVADEEGDGGVCCCGGGGGVARDGGVWVGDCGKGGDEESGCAAGCCEIRELEEDEENGEEEGEGRRHGCGGGRAV